MKKLIKFVAVVCTICFVSVTFTACCDESPKEIQLEREDYCPTEYKLENLANALLWPLTCAKPDENEQIKTSDIATVVEDFLNDYIPVYISIKGSSYSIVYSNDPVEAELSIRDLRRMINKKEIKASKFDVSVFDVKDGKRVNITKVVLTETYYFYGSGAYLRSILSGIYLRV